MKKTWHSLKNRVTAMLLALICVLGLLPTAALAAGADTIKLERFGMSGVSYQSASLGRCTMHQMYYGVAGKTSVGFSSLTLHSPFSTIKWTASLSSALTLAET